MSSRIGSTGSKPAVFVLLALASGLLPIASEAGAERPSTEVSSPVKVQLKSPARGLSSVIEGEPAWYSRPDAFPTPRVSRDVGRLAPPAPPRSSGNPLHYPTAWD